MPQNKVTGQAEEEKSEPVELSFKTTGTGIRSVQSLTSNSLKKIASHKTEVANNPEEEIKNKIVDILEALNEEEKQPVDSDNPVPINAQTVIEEIKLDQQSINRNQLYFDFEKNDYFIIKKTTSEIIEKIETLYKSKNLTTVECTSFINAVYNLFCQHIDKIAKTKKYLFTDEIVKNEYFNYILKIITKKGLFIGEIFNCWIENECKTHSDMNNFCMITINMDKFNEEVKKDLNERLGNQSTDNPKITRQQAIDKIYNALFKKLSHEKFWRPKKENKICKPTYLNKIGSFIKNYSNAKECTKAELDLIKFENKLNVILFNKLAELNIFTTKNNELTFNAKCHQNIIIIFIELIYKYCLI